MSIYSISNLSSYSSKFPAFQSQKKQKSYTQLLKETYLDFFEGAKLSLKNRAWDVTIASLVFFHWDEKVRHALFDIGFQKICIEAPIVEEFYFRGLIQDVALKCIPEYLVDVGVLDEGCLLSTEQRIECTTLLFTAAHLLNYKRLPAYYVAVQVLFSYSMGRILGQIKESKLGIMGSMGAHIANNSLTWVGVSLLDRALKSPASNSLYSFVNKYF